MQNRNLIFILASILLSVGPFARATTLERLNLDQLATAADAVARVRCVAVESRSDAGTIWTISTFKTVETLKGTLPTQITVRLPGGRVGHLTETVDGTPKFVPGEETVVFLERSRAGGFSVTGWVEGTFRIRHDSGTGQESVTQDSAAFSVFDAATRTFHFEGIHRMPFGQFRQRVAAAIARAKEKAQ
jgi:hypothetical protein